ncbi:MAG: phosphoribosylformimino-5-aminoimidazole carboxamide ribotide isomerase [Lachnospiraceae bacterium]|nr:phosphoribosylformimino-5-aminoimidazole carboxamide ribotide isomerase [Lachnospiraceae bacterium]
MRFRPCIDIHDGKVKQIVGNSLRDDGRGLSENFISDKDSVYYADIYKKYGLRGGHIAMLNSSASSGYMDTRNQAIKALNTFRGGLQVGGGVTAENAGEFIAEGASHVIVTSYVFREGKIDFGHLERLVKAVGSKHLVLDLSCRKKNKEDRNYYIVTDRWVNFTDVVFDENIFDRLSVYCDEFLVHAVDVEGKKSGIDENVLGILANTPYVVTYAGGVSSYDDIRLIKKTGRGKVDVTVGSALDIFGGHLKLTEVIECTRS